MTIIEKTRNTSYTPGFVMFHGSTVPPAGWFLCDGSTYDEIANPELFALLGVNTTPDFENEFVRAEQNQAWIDGFTHHAWTTGEAVVPMKLKEAGEHSHLFGTEHYKFNPGTEIMVDSSGTTGNQSNTSYAADHTHVLSGGFDAETAPRHVYLALIIKGD